MNRQQKSRSILPQRISRTSVAWRGDARFKGLQRPSLFPCWYCFGVFGGILYYVCTVTRPLAGCLGPFPCLVACGPGRPRLNSVNPHVMPPFLDC